MGNRRIILKVWRGKAVSAIRNEWSDEDMISHIQSMRGALLLQHGRGSILKGTDATGTRIISQISV